MHDAWWIASARADGRAPATSEDASLKGRHARFGQPVPLFSFQGRAHPKEKENQGPFRAYHPSSVRVRVRAGSGHATLLPERVQALHSVWTPGRPADYWRVTESESNGDGARLLTVGLYCVIFRPAFAQTPDARRVPPCKGPSAFSGSGRAGWCGCSMRAMGDSNNRDTAEDLDALLVTRQMRWCAAHCASVLCCSALILCSVHFARR
ncbi:hypothetical protein BV20DRAFT_38021 [Pilatotrama ljubarskyi]|nr:hypothetical protein BV20DRAFT_38021 [Pilatotrama ljubarskyi]